MENEPEQLLALAQERLLVGVVQLLVPKLVLRLEHLLVQ